jgi:prophage regulatory protein
MDIATTTDAATGRNLLATPATAPSPGRSDQRSQLAGISEHRLLRIAEVRERTALSTSTIYRLIAAGKFPGSIKLSERATAWLESDVTAWIAERVAQSRQLAAISPDTGVPRVSLS